MNILCIGDVCGHIGCEYLRRHLPKLKKENCIDLVVANGENSADGNGLLPNSAEHLFMSGVDIITGGNHIFKRREVYSLLDENEFILRPGNFPASANGRGIAYLDLGYLTVAVINLLGVVYMEPLECPFKTADMLIAEAKDHGARIIVVDFHAEATGEKKALGYYLDGRVSAVVGTHTHVQTADEQILPAGTAYITDIGMTGPINSVLGIIPQLAISKQVDKMPVRFALAEGECMMSGCIIEIDKTTGMAQSIKRINIREGLK
ncbi:MAG: TIGR00282 family metallophosphoesterase [Oscillospiraceae bacterium]